MCLRCGSVHGAIGKLDGDIAAVDAVIGVDHVVVVGRDLLMQPLRRMRQQVAVLVHGAALHQRVRPHQADRLLQSRCTIDDDGGMSRPFPTLSGESSPDFLTLRGDTLGTAATHFSVRHPA